MGQSAVDKILESRRGPSGGDSPAPSAEDDKFSLILIGEKMDENFLELKFRTGDRAAFPYGSIMYMNYDPNSGRIDVEFGVCLVSIIGRGLGERVFDGIKQKRVVWLKEADSEMQDHSGNDIFVKEILITLPEQGQAAAAA